MKDLIKKAKQVDLVDFCRSQGIPLLNEEANNPCLEEHDSLVFFPNSIERQWHRYSTGEGGDSIAFVEFYYNCSFKQALELLVKSEVQRNSTQLINKDQNLKPEPFIYSNKEVSGFSNTYRYLTKERGINPQILRLFIDNGLIKEDERKNIVFKWYDDGNIVGANLQGTSKKVAGKRSWKQIMKNSMSNYGFNIQIGHPHQLKFFESCIDLMSYMNLHNIEKNTWYISMEGLKPRTVSHYVIEASKQLNEAPNRISLCIDNDDPAKQFAKKLIDTMGVKNKTNQQILVYEPPKNHKDWNDELLDKLEVKQSQKRHVSEDRTL
ncbi:MULTISPECIES: DUF3991 and TOPRIM domain-containing protein [unclassified Aerococcus]|uniref:DUF3991 and TOPRIM domain-containing protein n=1 Tax=unclassified Aerococcus TaxID=2618060 RepID=UPI0008A1EA0D|nr:MULTISPECIES: DUF3991 and TOPRIM domain-containing protein [unclassified Aerococcus]MDK6679216.1 DUF3991 and TOPRIM domain-containing protein [Aerococcus sp. UMB8608]MDK6685942.1 DUF3991 and TOPRIM domain-containing protein [Aerococcus sp. UMB8623]MDK6939291.1 DUF3991 and TOPRIM domain-containing protein [Aerococcus sp. UMB8487]OFK21279.1 hypothetical protein HMPREF2829_03815 [Aerococcus sp. HMSC072A12]OFR32565.1 hypothetical protein HMPREF2892_08100 [Aerococcus sp. HMSC061A03]